MRKKREAARDDHETRRVKVCHGRIEMRVTEDELTDRSINKRIFHTLILDREYVRKKSVSVTHAYVNGQNGHRNFLAHVN